MFSSKDTSGPSSRRTSSVSSRPEPLTSVSPSAPPPPEDEPPSPNPIRRQSLMMGRSSRQNSVAALYGNDPHPPPPPPPPPESDGSGDEDDDEDQYPGGRQDQPSTLIQSGYNPSDYLNLETSPEVKELFTYILKFRPSPMVSQLEVKLRPFIPEFYPSVGDIDGFIKVRHASVPQGPQLGIQVLDEPTTFQSDPSVLDLRLRALAKQNSAKKLAVKRVENPAMSSQIIETWIKDISDLHRAKPSPSVHYSRRMPDLDLLLQEWPQEMEDLVKRLSLPIMGSLDCDLRTYVDIVCNLLDIPIYKSRIQSLHVLGTLYTTLKSLESYGQLGIIDRNQGFPHGGNRSGLGGGGGGDEVDRLEL